MAAPMHFQIPLLVLISSFLIPTPSASQSTPQNIQVYFPIPITPPPTTVITTSSTSSGSKTIAKAVAVTAATSLVFSGLFFLLLFKFKRRSKVQATNMYADTGINHSQVGLQKNDGLARVGGIKGVIVDEQGLDVFYWRRLEEKDVSLPLQEILKNKDNGTSSTSHCSKSQFEFDSPPVHKIPLLIAGTSSTSHVWPVDYNIKTQTLSDSLPVVIPLESFKTQPSMKSYAGPLPPLEPSNAANLTPPPPPQPAVVEMKGKGNTPSPPPPPPPVPIVVEMKGNAPPPSPPPPPPPPPPPIVVEMKGNAPPPSPPIVVVNRMGNASPPLLPKTNGFTSSSRQTLQFTAKGLESLRTQPSMKSYASPLPPLEPSNASNLTPPPPPPPAVVVEMKGKGNTPSPPPPTPPPPVPIVVEMKSNAPPPFPPPPPPPIVVEMKGNAPPPSPPPSPILVVKRMGNAPPPVLPKNGLTASTRQTLQFTAKGNMSSSDDNQIRFKPLHWDKVNADVEYSMVWHKLKNGSFRVNDDLMESLFGTMPIDKKTPRQGASNSPSPKAQMKSGLSQVFLLDTRKSQNIAIVIKSLAISRSKIIHCLLQGKGLDTDTLEKLTRITPSEEDIKRFLQFEGDITNLADAESFLYHVTKTVPAAFTRVRIMLFKSNFRSEVSDVKKSLQTLEMACKELKTRGLFVKLLEAVLKAGNRMNVGTSRGNAQAFNLNSLLKLSDVKSSDGKTTLLQFLVEEVVRSEGKRCNIKRNYSSGRSTGSLNTDAFTENYYIKLGLPVVGGVSSEFSNVKKAAGIDYDALSKSCSGLSDHLSEITETMEECDRVGNGGCFVREMLTFLKVAKQEIQLLREEEERIMGLVKITNEYYQAGTSKDIGGKQFQLFVIIRGFLNMVDRACLDIAIKLQKRRTGGGSPEAVIQMSRSPIRPPLKFPVLLANFKSTTSSSSSSSSSSSDSD